MQKAIVSNTIRDKCNKIYTPSIHDEKKNVWFIMLNLAKIENNIILSTHDNFVFLFLLQNIDVKATNKNIFNVAAIVDTHRKWKNIYIQQQQQLRIKSNASKGYVAQTLYR